jgi:putative membrane protein
MLTLATKWLVLALSVFLVSRLLPGIHVPDYMTALWVALVLGILNVTLRPVLKLITLPINIITLGLFTLIVNGFTFWLVPKFVHGFTVDTFWWAVGGAAIVSVIAAIIDRIVLGRDGKLG